MKKNYKKPSDLLPFNHSTKVIKLTPNVLEELRNYRIIDVVHRPIIYELCGGCKYYSEKKDVRDICTIISWYEHVLYDNVPFSQFLEYVRLCTCQQCLVKVTCAQACPDWHMRVLELIKDMKSRLLSGVSKL